MKLGLELATIHPTMLRLGTFFETWIATPTGTVRRSLGRDEYHLDLTIQPQRRLAGTGRTYICQVDLEQAGLGANGARECVLTEVELTPETPVIWGIRTNLFLSLPALREGATACLIREAADPTLFPIGGPLLDAEEIAPGRYVVDLTRALSCLPT